MNFFSKLRNHFRRVRGARRFQIPYQRAARLKIPKQVKIGDSMMAVDLPNDAGIRSDIMGCLLEDVYGLEELATPPAVILDIGANVGLFSIAARAFYPNACIHAYEPNPRTLPYLLHQAREAKFTVYGEAVGATEGTIAISDCGDSNLARTLPDPTLGERVALVPFSRAIDRLGRNVNLVKIDCEGAEWELFKDREAWSKLEQVRMEYHLFRGETFSELVRTLDDLCFTITKHVPSGNFGLVWCERR